MAYAWYSDGAKTHFTVLLNRDQVSELLRTKFSDFSDAHTTDNSEHILTHGSLKAVGDLTFYPCIQKKVEKATGEPVPIGRLAAQPSRIRHGDPITSDGNGKKVRFKLELTDEE